MLALDILKRILMALQSLQKLKIKKGILNFSVNHERRIEDYLKSREKSGSLATDE